MVSGLAVAPQPQVSQMPYRFSPIESTGQLTEAVEYVTGLAGVLAESLTGRRPPVHYVTIFAHYQAEYTELCQLLAKLGRSILTNSGAAAKLHHPIDVAGQHITNLRIRQPDPYRMQVGCCDLDVPDYQAFKAAHFNELSPTVRQVHHRELEMLEIFAPGFDILAYVVGPYHSARQRFYRPLLHTATGKPTITYPSNDEGHLDQLLSRTTARSVEDFVEATLSVNEKLVEPADYLISIPWSDGKQLYLDVWMYQMANITQAGPLVTAFTFADQVSIDDAGTTSGDGLMLLGYEEALRHTSKSLNAYLTNPDRCDDLPHACRADEDFYTLHAIRS
jgi:hypothetical protein